MRNNSELSETVSRAAMLQVITCDVAALNKNDRKTSLVRNIKKLQFSFVIAKNITCEPGLKNLYARIMTPQGELLGEDETKLFAFESGEIPYTLVQPIEYGGETYEGVCYYALADNEKIEEGFYTIDFFCNGDLIGSPLLFEIREGFENCGAIIDRAKRRSNNRQSEAAENSRPLV